jgi:hypothetical protein
VGKQRLLSAANDTYNLPLITLENKKPRTMIFNRLNPPKSVTLRDSMRNALAKD